jgi:hypothetical protein
MCAPNHLLFLLCDSRYFKKLLHVANSLWVHQYNGQLIFCDIFNQESSASVIGVCYVIYVFP